MSLLLIKYYTLMKPFGYLFFFFVCTLSFQTSHSQTVNKPWTLSFGTHAINNPVREQEAGLGRFKTWNQNPAGFRLSAGRLIKNSFSFEAVASLNSIKENYPNPDPEVLDPDYPYISLDGMFKYQFSNGLNVVDPYLTIGAGYTWLDTIGAGTINGGVGFNIWIGHSFGFNVQSVYKHAFEDYGLKHYQHSAGIIFRFGGKDTDNDGINDAEDACPELFGTFEAKGCPDTDKDGVIDSEDLCPNDFGPAAMRGCPDNDGDGTPDKYDDCPEVQGAINDGGCPLLDTDKDGVIDSKDKCPQQPGPPENGGCPTPLQLQEQANLVSQQQRNRNKAIKEEVTNKLNALSRTIVFNKGNAVLSQQDKLAIDEISKIMESQPKMKFHIAGHTDSTGSSPNNLTLSEQRAKSVKEYLISIGIDGQRLTSQGYGEVNPIADNNTEEGRLANRRVEIFVVN